MTKTTHIVYKSQHSQNIADTTYAASTRTRHNIPQRQPFATAATAAAPPSIEVQLKKKKKIPFESD